jgi:hypothetical protein
MEKRGDIERTPQNRKELLFPISNHPGTCGSVLFSKIMWEYSSWWTKVFFIWNSGEPPPNIG